MSISMSYKICPNWVQQVQEIDIGINQFHFVYFVYKNPYLALILGNKCVIHALKISHMLLVIFTIGFTPFNISKWHFDKIMKPKKSKMMILPQVRLCTINITQCRVFMQKPTSFFNPIKCLTVIKIFCILNKKSISSCLESNLTPSRWSFDPL